MTEFAMTPLSDITEGPNVRSKLGDLSELAASLSSTGMLQPVTVRRKPVSGGLELVFGFRRFRAAKLAKLPEIPTLTRELTDDEVLEAQLSENGQREGCDPIDEAHGYQRLLTHMTVPELAAKMGRSPAHIAQRLRLCSLSAKATEALHNESITLGVALLVAKLPTAELQDKALELVSSDYEDDGPMPVATAKKHIEEQVMRDLKSAPFDRVSLDLVPVAGSCTACPKRTGVQVQLFSDDTSPDLCTDPVCFRSKLDAHWAIVQKEAKAKGLEVLTKAKAEAATRHHDGGDSGFRKLDDTVYIGDKKRTVRQLLGGKDAEPTAIARDEVTGTVVELAPKRDVEAAIKEARKAAGAKDPDEAYSETAKREADKRKAAKARRAALVERLALEVEKDRSLHVTLLRGLVFAAIEVASTEARAAVVKRRGLKDLADTPTEKLIRLKAENEEVYGRLLGMLVELLVTSREQAFLEAVGDEPEGAGLYCMSALGLSASDVGERDAKPEKAAKAKPAPRPTNPVAAAAKAESSLKRIARREAAKAKKKAPKRAKKGAKR